MHFVLAIDGALQVRAGRGAWRAAAGVLTAPDVPHAIDASGREVLLVFLDPESEAGAALHGVLDGPLRALSDAERAALVEHTDPWAIMGERGVAWTQRAIELLGGAAPTTPVRRVHPRVRSLLRRWRTGQLAERSLEALADEVGLSPGRLMHVFTESIGIPLRPYLAWLRLQRAAGAIVAGSPLGEAAHAAGFADSAHMTRTFRRMFGLPPSELRPRG